ncbi:MAG: hypothetical protein H0V36_08375 [Chloroflexi bacterium]|nr:hypothetical protein [Chloroflexota bacterium]
MLVHLLDSDRVVVGTATVDDGKLIATGELVGVDHLYVPDLRRRSDGRLIRPGRTITPNAGDAWLLAMRYLFRTPYWVAVVADGTPSPPGPPGTGLRPRRSVLRAGPALPAAPHPGRGNGAQRRAGRRPPGRLEAIRREAGRSGAASPRVAHAPCMTWARAKRSTREVPAAMAERRSLGVYKAPADIKTMTDEEYRAWADSVSDAMLDQLDAPDPPATEAEAAEADPA